MAKAGSQSGKAPGKAKERQSEEDRRAEERRLARLRRQAERRHGSDDISAYKGPDRRRFRDRRAEDLDRRLAYNRRRSRGRRGGYDREAGLKRLGIDESTCKALRDFQPVLAKHMDAILGDYEALAPAFRRGTGAKRWRTQLKRRWLEDVFGGRFKGAEMRQRTSAYRSSKGMELESPWFMPGYCFILGRVTELAATTYAQQPEQMVAVLDALTKAVFLDMDLAAFNYTGAIDELSPWADVLSPEEIAILMGGNR